MPTATENETASVAEFITKSDSLAYEVLDYLNSGTRSEDRRTVINYIARMGVIGPNYSSGDVAELYEMELYVPGVSKLINGMRMGDYEWMWCTAYADGYYRLFIMWMGVGRAAS
jgi:hypothetical protein